MNSEVIIIIVQIIAALGVVVSVVYLAVQIHQQNEITVTTTTSAKTPTRATTTTVPEPVFMDPAFVDATKTGKRIFYETIPEAVYRRFLKYA